VLLEEFIYRVLLEETDVETSSKYCSVGIYIQSVVGGIYIEGAVGEFIYRVLLEETDVETSSKYCSVGIYIQSVGGIYIQCCWRNLYTGCCWRNLYTECCWRKLM